MIWRRAFAIWLVIIAAETLHGIVRAALLTPVVGDLAARQIGVAVGSLIVLAVAVVFARWLGAQSLREALAIGLAWVVLTVAFELALGTLLGLSGERLLVDYDLTAGGYLGLGLLVMLLAPAVAAKLRR